MLSTKEYSAVKIHPAKFKDTSALRLVAAAAGATDVPLENPPADGWPDCTCSAVIAAAEARTATERVLPYPFVVGDAACRNLRDYKAMRAVAQACMHWNAFVDKLIAAQGTPGGHLHDLARALELSWSVVDVTLAAATATAFADLCRTAPIRVAAVVAWRAAATYLTEGDARHLAGGLANNMLVRSVGLTEHAAANQVEEHLLAAVATLKSQKPKCVAEYTANVHQAMAWAKHAGKTPPGALLVFHTDALNRAKTGTIPPEITAAVRKTVAGWTSELCI
jgi:hypothetical protein